MEIIRSIAEMQETAEALRLEGKKIGFVPTMGYLHEGHLSLLRIAEGLSDVRVLSIFVNPTQFAPNEDLDRYPRDFKHDEALARRNGCDILFYPTAEEMYPVPYRTYVTVEEITRVLCGRSRPTHFRGVTTVVTKLFHIVKPHVAVFGQKDAQQAIVIKQMVRDLNFDVQIVVGPIVREEDGLALSSRNVYLSPEERKEAPLLYKSLLKAKERIEKGEREAGRVRRAIEETLQKAPHARVDYIEIVDTRDLKPLQVLEGEVLIALAVYFGKTRLIDNMMIRIE